MSGELIFLGILAVGIAVGWILRGPDSGRPADPDDYEWMDCPPDEDEEVT